MPTKFAACSVCGDPRPYGPLQNPASIICHGCRREAKGLPRERGDNARICQCGRTFAHRVNKYCSHCIAESVYSPPRERICGHCASPIVSRDGHRKYCDGCARDRVWQAGKPTIRRERIFARDRWRCGICGEGVDKNLRWPDSRSASVDHKVPSSLGGSDHDSNLQCAHLGCNSRKQNKGGGEQLALEVAC